LTVDVRDDLEKSQPKTTKTATDLLKIREKIRQHVFLNMVYTGLMQKGIYNLMTQAAGTHAVW